MDVMPCHRNNCDAILCRRYSDEYGYICCECFDELVSLGPTADIFFFMDTPKKSNREEEGALARFEVAFPLNE